MPLIQRVTVIPFSDNGGDVGVALVARFAPTVQKILADIVFRTDIIGIHHGVGGTAVNGKEADFVSEAVGEVSAQADVLPAQRRADIAGHGRLTPSRCLQHAGVGVVFAQSA